MTIHEIETSRLLLRQWRQSDKEPFSALNADPRVMEYFPSILSRAQSDNIADRCMALIAEHGWGFWVAESKSSRSFLGFVGLHNPSEQLPFSPCVEIGWRLAHEHWGKGYATEAAREVLRFAFGTLELDEVVSFTTTGNLRSQAVMQRLGMDMAGTFEHPEVPEESGLKKHCLYRITRERYAAQPENGGAPSRDGFTGVS